MGYSHTKNATKRNIRAQIIQPEDFTTEEGVHIVRKVLKHKIVGNEFWTLAEESRDGGAPVKKINLFLLHNDKGFGWGYKAITEKAGPAYYQCPPEWLDEAPVADENWRDNVRAFHARRARAALAVAHIKAGDWVPLERARIPYVIIVTTDPLRGSYKGKTYRIPADLVDVEKLTAGN